MKTVSIIDAGTVVKFDIEGEDISMVECGGTPALELLAFKIDGRTPSKALARQVLDIWLDGYDIIDSEDSGFEEVYPAGAEVSAV